MNKYEIMFIVKPDVEEEARNTLIENFKSILTANGGSVDNVNEWGLRDFAVTCAPAEIAEFERLSRINASVLRHLTLRK